MKNKIFYFILIILTTLLIITCHKKEVNKFDFPQTICINNFTNYNITTELSVIVNKIFKYDTMYVNIAYSKKIISNDIIIEGYIQKNIYTPHSYIIFLKEGLTINVAKRILYHELVHLKQMEIGDLVQLQTNKMILYKKDIIIFNKVSYFDRQYEIDAFAEEHEVIKQLNEI